MDNVDGLYRFKRLRAKAAIIVCSNTFHLLVIKKLSFRLQISLFLSSALLKCYSK